MWIFFIPAVTCIRSLSKISQDIQYTPQVLQRTSRCESDPSDPITPQLAPTPTEKFGTVTCGYLYSAYSAAYKSPSNGPEISKCLRDSFSPAYNTQCALSFTWNTTTPFTLPLYHFITRAFTENTSGRQLLFQFRDSVPDNKNIKKDRVFTVVREVGQMSKLNKLKIGAIAVGGIALTGTLLAAAATNPVVQLALAATGLAVNLAGLDAATALISASNSASAEKPRPEISHQVQSENEQVLDVQRLIRYCITPLDQRHLLPSKPTLTEEAHAGLFPNGNYTSEGCMVLAGGYVLLNFERRQAKWSDVIANVEEKRNCLMEASKEVAGACTLSIEAINAREGENSKVALKVDQILAVFKAKDLASPEKVETIFPDNPKLREAVNKDEKAKMARKTTELVLMYHDGKTDILVEEVSKGGKSAVINPVK